MLIKWRVPLTIQWMVRLFIVFFIFFTAQRVATFISFKPGDYTISDLLPSFVMGIQYDLRWISILLLPIVILSFIPYCSPFSSITAKKVWTNYLAIITIILLIIFGADFGHFAYVSTRLNASAMNFIEDPAISFKMVWESYPIIWIFIGIVIAGGFFAWVYQNFYHQVIERNVMQELPHRRRWYGVILIIFVFNVWGKFSNHPLYWSDAFKLDDNFKSYLALNPMQNFFTTYSFRKPEASETKARQYFPVISNFLELDKYGLKQFGFERTIFPSNRGLESKPNIVLVICESFSMYKSTMGGNALNTTPYFNQLAKNGIFFDHAFSPHFATARGVFSILTGIPDVQLSKFSSREEASLNQRTIINDFEEYKKYYFIGGSSEFNNFKGLLNNIKNINIYEENNYASKPVNVWGISDKDLFKESINVLNKNKTPFFAIIQTADNHRPFTIPEADTDFIKNNISEDTLQRYGFSSLDEYQAFCYSDYAFKYFIETAKKQPWFDNTIFVFVGDHGVAGNCKGLFPDCWTNARLSDEHIALLFYAPKLLVPQWRHETVSQIDVLPTIAGMVHMPYSNTTLGRDVLNSVKKNNGAFTIHHDEGKIGFVSDSFYFVKNIRFQQQQLYPLFFNQQMPSIKIQDSLKNYYSKLTSAFLETARWMLLNNKSK